MQPTIATVSLNSAIDQTVTVPRFTVDAVNRVEAVQVDAGGKGVNVASFLAHFGHATAVAGLLGRENDAIFARHFEQAGIRDACTRCDGATRTNVKIVDPVLDQVTDVNLPGVQAGPEELASVSGTLAGLMARGLTWVGLCGSLPAGLGADSYARLALQARAGGVKVALDTSGAPLGPALAACPDIVKPNAEELGAYLGRELTTLADVQSAARDLVAQGVGLVSVSMGAAGAVLVRGDEAVHARPPRITVASTVGAGDAMVAGLIHAATLGLDLAEMARIATAFSLGALGEIGPRLPAIARIDALARDVEITALG
ncbi:fructose-1-phosphate kinase [Rhodobacter aestuarii]|uniref:Phosphofructokinase n=1 Tax=Rhodobacter aestuarii TaxID=453582 RepID=A0A1N7MU39_9RHOB|nr:1-phosphofructokinase [Rhodobacter aestuarii]PTV96536.1 fructose-1-phosphate kinase [Rhodobacter aestuarii]SIS89518.1 fructose-1-phosphate kinase [Rhodobacter aestuarii]